VSAESMNLTLRVWRQAGPAAAGRFETYQARDVSPDMSFLEMLDQVNRELILKGKEPIAFEHDCREGICGACSLVINGQPHGPELGTTVCQSHMRQYKGLATITIEPWRARAFPVVKDLIVDRSALDKIIMAGGYVSVNTGAPQDANALPVPKANAELAMDAAACIGCGACVAACPNASAMLFLSAKISQLALLPQGAPERGRRAYRMLKAMDEAGFGNCANVSECQAACPKEINVSNIARLNREYLRSVAAYVPD